MHSESEIASSAEESVDEASSPVESAPSEEEVATEATSDGPSVDSLDDRLRDLQGAMDKIQSGDLDGAEQAIEALEQQMEVTRD